MNIRPVSLSALWLLSALALSVGTVQTASAQLPQIVPGQSSAAPVRKPVDPINHESWEVVYLGENRIGYAHAKARLEVQGKQRIVVTTSDLHLTFKRLGDTTVIKTHQEVTESLTGAMLSFVYEMRNPPKSSSRTEAKVESRWLRLETQTGDRRDRRSRNWDPETKSPVFQDRSIRQTPLKPGETRTFKTFLPELDAGSTVKFSTDDYRFVKLLDGKQHKLLKVRVTQSVNPTLTTRAYYNADGEVMLTETALLGQQMRTYRVSQEEALKKIAGEELDLIVNTLVPVDPIQNGHATKRVVYRITLEEDDPSRFFVQGPTQEVKRINPQTVELTVTQAKIPPKPRKETPARDEYLKSTRWLQSDDSRVQQLARHAAAAETDPVKLAYRLESYVQTKLDKKNFSTALASAAEVAASLEGDCTEHAMLLAAMLRAKNIPSRVAVGLVYVESAESFGGHMWTEAYLNGAWIPLDATMGRGGIGAAHIKLAESSLSDDAPVMVTAFMPMMQILGKVKIEVLRAE